MLGLVVTLSVFVYVVWYFRHANIVQPPRIANPIKWVMLTIIGIAVLSNLVIVLFA